MSTVEQLKQRLHQALEINRILKRQSLEDWRDGVDIFSTHTGEKIRVGYDYNENKEVIGIYYVVPLDEKEMSHQTPLEDGITYLADHNLFESEDRQWGEDLAFKLKGAYLMSVAQAKLATQKLAKYADLLSEANLQVPFYPEIAHRYDPSAQPTKVICGDELGSPFGDVDDLQAALKQKPEPSQVSQRLAKNGQIWLGIGQSFQNRTSALDGLDVISSAASLGGAVYLLLSAALEKFRHLDAKRFDPDNDLGGYLRDLKKFSSDFQKTEKQALTILAARGETLLDNSIVLKGDTRHDLAQFSTGLIQKQSVLIQAIDPTRMPEPISVEGSNESLRGAIHSLAVRDKDLTELVAEATQKEQPIKTLDGAIQAQHLYEQSKQFFAAREEAHQRLFNPNLAYQRQTQEGLTLKWNAQQFQVTNAHGKSLLNIVRDDEGFKVVGHHPSPTLVTALTHLPTSAESLRRLAAESSLRSRLNEIAPFYGDKQLKIQSSHKGELCTFTFDNDNKAVIATDRGRTRLWHHQGGQILLDRMPLGFLEKISSQLSRPQAVQSRTIEQPQPQPILSL